MEILIIDDTAFMGSQRARNMSTLKTKHLPLVQAAEVVIYIGTNGNRIIKGTGYQLRTIFSDID